MQDWVAFREQVKELLRRCYPYENNHPATITDLASGVGLSRAELSRRLNGSSGCCLSPRDSRAIVRQLVEWGGVSSRTERCYICCI